ncbi:MAG TPA: MFS transporter [Acidimicrobiales bacterium]|nr:MFS transporter [Acidimicrobiales bacterium]
MDHARYLVDISPMRRFRDFRRLWFGLVLAQIGAQLGIVAASYQVYRITGSSLDVGFISLIQLLPSLFGSVIGGSIADAMDRRKLLIITEVAMAACTTGLAFNSRGDHPSLVLIFLLAGLSAGFAGIDGPTRSAMLMATVDRDSFVAANTLRQLMIQVAVIVGPAIGGLLLAPIGIAGVYWLNAGAFALTALAITTLNASPPIGGGTRFGWSSVSEGFAFLRGRQALQACFIADLNATILGMPTSLFPALGLVHFHGGPRAVGFLYAAPGIGALAATVLSGWTNRVRLPGRAVVIAIAIWGVAITVFGLVPDLVLALVFLGIAGAADVISAVFRGAIVQLEAHDQLRGRISAIQLAVVSSGPRLGNLEAGGVAQAFSDQISVVSGGLGALLGIVVIARLMPRFLSYEISHTETDISTGWADPPEPPRL